jgi:hypothetical protein
MTENQMSGGHLVNAGRAKPLWKYSRREYLPQAPPEICGDLDELGVETRQSLRFAATIRKY